MAKSDLPPKLSRFLMLASIAIVVAALYLAQEFLVPIALATLFSFLLAPLVHWLERLRLPRPAAVLITVAIAFSIVGGIGYVVYYQLNDFSRQLPQYHDNIQAKVTSLKSGNGFFASVKNAREEVQHILNAPASGPTSGPASQPATQSASRVEGSANKPGSPSRSKTPPDNKHLPEEKAPTGPPVPVTVTNGAEPNGSGPFGILENFGGYLLGPIGTAFIVSVFTIFMLIQREDLRDRIIRLVGRQQLTVTTEALDDAGDRVSRYLLMQSIVNGSVGVAVMVCLWLVGKLNGQPFPNPALWGLLAALLRFIPYIGVWVSAIVPVLISLAVYSKASVSLETIGAYGLIEIIAANALEPLLFGSSTGLATLAVLVSAAFWTWLWGPVGLLLSTPMTVCLVVIGKYVPALSFLNILLGDEPALSQPDRVYQRLLALDDEEASSLVIEYYKTIPLEELYDTVLMPVLAMAERDRHMGNLDEERHAAIHRGMRDILDELGDRERLKIIKEQAEDVVARAKSPTNTSENDATPKPAPQSPPPGALVAGSALGSRLMLPKGCDINVICLPANDEADEIAGIMFSQLLELRGYRALTVSVERLASEMVETVEKSKADLVCVSALPPAAVTHARYLCKRLHGKLPDIAMIVGLWTSRGDLKSAKERIACVHTVQMTSSLREAMDQAHQLIQPRLMSPEPDPAPLEASNS